MTGRSLIALGASVLLAACATTVTPVGTAPVGEGFAVSGAQFSTGTTIDFAIAPREEQGFLALCGAYVVRNATAQTIPITQRALASGQVQIAGATVLRDPTRFSRLADGAPLDGAPARCLVTETAWQPVFAAAEPDTRFVRQVFDRDSSEPSAVGGQSVVFRERR